MERVERRGLMTKKPGRSARKRPLSRKGPEGERPVEPKTGEPHRNAGGDCLHYRSEGNVSLRNRDEKKKKTEREEERRRGIMGLLQFTKRNSDSSIGKGSNKGRSDA